MGSWVIPAGPSISLGTSRPCQCTVVDSSSSLVTSMRIRSPWVTCSRGPGICPLYAYASTVTPGRISQRICDTVSSNTLTPSSMRAGSSTSSPRVSTSYAAVAARGSTAAMSRIASAGVSRVMIIPGGMISPPTSCALRVMLTAFAGATIPTTSAIAENAPTTVSCGTVTAPAPEGWCASCPDPGDDAPPAAWSWPACASGGCGLCCACASCSWGWLAGWGRTVIRPCLRPFFTIHTFTG